MGIFGEKRWRKGEGYGYLNDGEMENTGAFGPLGGRGFGGVDLVFVFSSMTWNYDREIRAEEGRDRKRYESANYYFFFGKEDETTCFFSRTIRYMTAHSSAAYEAQS